MLYYFVIPVSVSIALFCLLPTMTRINKTSKNEDEFALNESIFTNEPSIETLAHTTETDDHIIANTETTPEQHSGIIQETIEIPKLTAELTDNSAIQEIIEKKIEPVGEEIYKIKGDTASLREDMSTIKTSIGDMFSKFEDAMIDLKSLQSEITNPLNFVQKNVESNEFKDVLAIKSTDKVGHLSIVPTTSYGLSLVDTNENKPKQKDQNTVSFSSQTTNELNNFKEMFHDKLTLGKLMSIVSLIGDIIQKSGKDSVNVLTDQCKIMGLDSDMMETIHNIARMLNNSKISISDTLILLYRFGQIVGINDKEANEHYVRLTSNANQSQNNSKRIPHEEYF
ncbi:MAG: hypothetical protein ACT4OD_00195 [Candidatus Nitrosotenuis sp.]